jgi:hypothetical protein
MPAFSQQVPDQPAVNPGHSCATRGPSKTGYCPSCAPSPHDTNVAPPPAPLDPEHILMTKQGQTRRILKADATPEVMAAFFWEPWHPTDYANKELTAP